MCASLTFSIEYRPLLADHRSRSPPPVVLRDRRRPDRYLLEAMEARPYAVEDLAVLPAHALANGKRLLIIGGCHFAQTTVVGDARLRKPGDEMALEAALNGRYEDVLITFNVRDYAAVPRSASNMAVGIRRLITRTNADSASAFVSRAKSPNIAWVPAMWAHLSWVGKVCACWVRRSALAMLIIVLTSAAVAAQSAPGQPNLKALFAVVGRTHNIDPDLLEAMAEVESGDNPLSVSPKGALGLMQLTPATASEFSVLNPFNPVANVIGAADFLDYLRTRLAHNSSLQGLPDLLAAYNAGPGTVERYGGLPPFAETNRYVQRVMELYTNNLSPQATGAPVLILEPRPYIIQLGPGSHATQPEPVLISGGSGSVAHRLAVIRNLRGQVIAVAGPGAAHGVRPIHTTPFRTERTPLSLDHIGRRNHTQHP